MINQFFLPQLFISYSNYELIDGLEDKFFELGHISIDFLVEFMQVVDLFHFFFEG